MAIQDSTHVAPFGAIAIHRIVTGLEKLGTNLKVWNTQRKTVAALNALSDHELEDIGLHRSNIHEMASRFSTQA